MTTPIKFNDLIASLDNIDVKARSEFQAWCQESHAEELDAIVANLELVNGTGDEAWTNAPEIRFFTEGLLLSTQRLPLDQVDLAALWPKVQDRLRSASLEARTMLNDIFVQSQRANLLLPISTFPDGTDDDGYIRELSLRVESGEPQWRASWDKQKRDNTVTIVPDKGLMFQIKDQWRFVEEILEKNGNMYEPITFRSWLSLADLVAKQAEHLQAQHWKAIVDRFRARKTEEPEKKPILELHARVAENLWEEGKEYWDPNLDIDIMSFRNPDKLDPHYEALRRFIPGNNDPGDLTGAWSHKETLGKGSYGCAMLWLQYNASRRIVDRLVTKDSVLQDWYQPAWWEDPMRLRIPKEYAITKTLSDVGDVNNTIQCHSGFGLFRRIRVFRLYLEHCEHGSLSDLLESHRARRDHSDPLDTPSAYLIPVRAMCGIFEHLTAALCMMDLGGLPGGVLSDTQKSIVHLDITPDNVLLSKPDANHWPGVPTSKITDFGASERLDYPDLDRKRVFGTEGYKAPEQTQDRGDSAYDEPLSTKTNVWSMGKVMFDLMNLEQGSNIDNVRPEFKKSALEFYPEWLIHCVLLCLRKMPFQRPTPKMLWELIHLEMDFAPKETGISMKEALGDPNEVLLYQPDKYKDLMAG